MIKLTLSVTLTTMMTVCCLMSIISATGTSQPNIVIILADDLGYGDLSCFGNESISTPHLDKLAQQGAKFTQMLSPAPVCSPSRSGLMTGKYPVRSGMVSSVQNFRTINSPAIPGGLPLAQQTFSEYLKTKGYTTGMFGKWHLGIHEGEQGTQDFKLLPNKRGFDTFFGMPVTNVQTCDPNKTIYYQSTLFHYYLTRTGHIWLSMYAAVAVAFFFGVLGSKKFLGAVALATILMGVGYYYTANFFLLSPHACILMRNDKIVQQPLKLQNLTRNLARESVDFISANKDKPFLLYLPFVKVHTALFTTDEYKGHSKAGPFGDNVEEMDWAVGQITQALKDNNLDENTLVFFSSDNGPFLERGDEAGSTGFVTDDNGNKQNLRGGKAQNWEGGIRVPGIVRWTGVVQPNTVVEQAATLMDVFPTIVEIVNGDNAQATLDSLNLDGKSLIDVVTGKVGKGKHVHDVLFHYCGDVISAVRVGDFKLHYSTPKWENQDSHACPSATICSCAGNAVNEHDPPLIFNLRKDPGESNPLPADQHKQLIATAKSAVDQHKLTVKPVKNQLEQFARPWLFPCCNDKCECDHEKSA